MVLDGKTSPPTKTLRRLILDRVLFGPSDSQTKVARLYRTTSIERGSSLIAIQRVLIPQVAGRAGGVGLRAGPCEMVVDREGRGGDASARHQGRVGGYGRRYLVPVHGAQSQLLVTVYSIYREYPDSRFNPHSGACRATSLTRSTAFSLRTETMPLTRRHPRSKARARAQPPGRRRTTRIGSSSRRSPSRSGSQRPRRGVGRGMGRRSGVGVVQRLRGMVDLAGAPTWDG